LNIKDDNIKLSRILVGFVHQGSSLVCDFRPGYFVSERRVSSGNYQNNWAKVISKQNEGIELFYTNGLGVH
jgi:hypothetical protein